jgi:ubiquinone/menaquinone biosynthesis C-methylase UbiE
MRKWYERHVFPRVVDATLKNETVARLRRQVLETARPRVLELGFGTGLNLPCYPATIEEITAADLGECRPNYVIERLRESRVRVHLETMDATRLGFPDAGFATVVTSFFLCSVPSPEAVLQEIWRVLEPQGRYLFLEHGACPSPVLRVWQKVMLPLTRSFGCGCRPNLPIGDLIQSAGFRLDALREMDLGRLGRASGHLFLGQARKF